MHSYNNRVYMHSYCSKCVNIIVLKGLMQEVLWLKCAKFISFSIMQEDAHKLEPNTKERYAIIWIS